MQVKRFELNPVQRRLLVQLWANQAEQTLFAVMSKQWMDAIAKRILKSCEPEQLLALRAARDSINSFFESVSATAVAYGMPGQVAEAIDARSKRIVPVPPPQGTPFGTYGVRNDSQEAGQEVGRSPLPREEAW